MQPLYGRTISWAISATLCIVVVLSFGRAAQPSQTQPKLAAEKGTDDHHGYALLFSVLKDEKDVAKLLVIKRERPELKALVKEIAETTGRGFKQLEAFAKSERSLDLKDRGLPAAEVETRSAIAKTKAKELITEGGKEFELRMLLSQNEALTYAAHLAETVAKSEVNPTRAGYLRQLATELQGLQHKVAAMLLSNYSWAAK
jgi:hypothetical protein